MNQRTATSTVRRLIPLTRCVLRPTLVVVVSAAPVVTAQDWTPLVMQGRTTQGVSTGGLNYDVVVQGGRAGAATVGDTWSLGSGAWSQVDTGGMEPSPRTGHAMAFAMDLASPSGGTTVLFGGQDTTGALADTWTFDGNCWDTQDPALLPPPRVGHDMVYDPGRGVVVMFGGVNPNVDPPLLLQDTWEWDGTNWHLVLSSPVAPSPRQNHRMAFDTNANSVILFAGSDASGQCLDTWEYNGITWTNMNAAPPFGINEDDYDIASEPDLSGGVLMLMGGETGGGESWEVHRWSGGAWSLLASGSDQCDVVNRADPRLSYDQATNRMFLHGGGLRDFGPGTITPITDVWEWNGSGWTLFDLGAPVPRYGPAMAWDQARSELVFVAGGLPPRSLKDSYTFDGVNWTQYSLPVFSGPMNAVIGHDPVTDRTILLGGEPEDYPGGGTALRMIWDGTSWNSFGMSSPSFEAESFTFVTVSDLVGGEMTFDHDREVLVCVGGRYQLGFNDVDSHEVWELPANSTTWTMVQPGVEPDLVPFARGRVAYDAALQRVVAVDGQGWWTWDGVQWQLQVSNNYPGPGPIAYDSARQRMVLSNGSGTYERLGATWLHRTTAGIGNSSDAKLFYDEVNNQMIGVAEADVIRLYAPDVVWSFNSYGAACGGPEGTPMLQMVTPPIQGMPYVTQVTPYPINSTGWMLFGASRTVFNGVPLPLSLDPIGMTGCALHTEVWDQYNLTPTGFSIVQLPPTAAVIGGYFTQQAFVLWPGANPLGLVATNAAEFIVGG